MAPLIRRIEDCDTESWASPAVQWWTLFSSDRTPTSELTVGVAHIPPGAEPPLRGHRHAEGELYYFLSGKGFVSVDGEIAPVRTGDAVFIPGNSEHFAANDGDEVLSLLYVFAKDSFDEITYEFPGESEPPAAL